MKRYDLVVVGAGPAGSCAAASAARAGMRVALLERERLPRHKTCGGGIPMTIASSIRDLAPGAFVECVVRQMRLTWQFGDPALASIDAPDSDRDVAIWMVRRCVFDLALAERAARLGAELIEGVRVREVVEEPDGVRVRGEASKGAGAWMARAEYVIGSDGANGVVARCAGLRRSRTLAIAMEVEHPHRWGEGRPELSPQVMHLDFGSVPYGYAWAFPKADHLNVGAGVLRPLAGMGQRNAALRDDLRNAITNYMAALGVDFDPSAAEWHAHPLPVWSGRERLHTRSGRILLAGDAAGLVNPLFGDGILHAVRSGEIAGACVAEGAASEYTRRIHDRFARNFDAARRMAGFFYRWTRLCYAHGVKRPGAAHTAALLLAGEAPFPEFAARAMRRFRSALRQDARLGHERP